MTNKEIAKQLGVSETTLSFILNNKPGIADKTRARVIAEITALGYDHLLRKSPLPLARSIAFVVHKRRGHILGQSPFYLLLMEQIEAQARNHGFNVILRMIDADDSPDEQIRDLNASDLSGLIVFATEMLDDDMEHFKRASMPLVSLDNDFTHLEMDSVVINNRVGTLKAVQHLVENGHREIGYLRSKAFINSFGERDDGYRRAFRRFGVDPHSAFLFDLGFTEEESYQDFRSILAAGAKLPTAFVADDDLMVVGVLRALTEHGVRVPEDVSLVGFDDRPVCLLTKPRLTSLSVPKGAFGSLAVDLLVERISRPRKDAFDYRLLEVGVQLVARESSRAVKA